MFISILWTPFSLTVGIFLLMYLEEYVILFPVVFLGSVLQLHSLSQHRSLFALTAHLTPDSKYFDCTALSLYFNCNYINILFCMRKSILSSILFFSGSDPEQRFLYRHKRALLAMLSLMYDEVWPRQVSLPQWAEPLHLHLFLALAAYYEKTLISSHPQKILGTLSTDPWPISSKTSGYPLHTLCTHSAHPMHPLSAHPLHTLCTPSHTLSNPLQPSLHSLHIISTPCTHQDGWRPPNS